MHIQYDLDYSKNYAKEMVINFSRIAGDFTPGIYTEDCLFEDPTIKFRGV